MAAPHFARSHLRSVTGLPLPVHLAPRHSKITLGLLYIAAYFDPMLQQRPRRSRLGALAQLWSPDLRPSANSAKCKLNK